MEHQKIIGRYTIVPQKPRGLRQLLVTLPKIALVFRFDPTQVTTDPLELLHTHCSNSDESVSDDQFLGASKLIYISFGYDLKINVRT